MSSFYGGPVGKSFEIKKVFSTYSGNTDSILEDIGKGFGSPIAVGEFVVISYGVPGTTAYNTNVDIDDSHSAPTIYKYDGISGSVITVSQGSKYFNGTIWQKAYGKVGNTDTLVYALVTSVAPLQEFTGSRIFAGTSVPTTQSSVPGSKLGDIYINTTDGVVYTLEEKNNSETWVAATGSLTGPQGPQGEKGETGDQGAQGSIIFSGTQTPSSTYQMDVEGAKPGDVYINTNSGKIYRLGSNNKWIEATGSLKGPVGSGLNIVAAYSFSENEVENTLSAIAARIEVLRTSKGLDRYPGPEELIEVNWISADESQTFSYWFFYTTETNLDDSTSGVWSRVVLTGTSAVHSIAYEYSIAPADWSENRDQNGYYTYKYVNTALRCGVQENVPPIISCADKYSEYYLIDRADAVSGDGITFYASEKPATRIDLTIVDLG